MTIVKQRLSVSLDERKEMELGKADRKKMMFRRYGE